MMLEFQCAGSYFIFLLLTNRPSRLSAVAQLSRSAELVQDSATHVTFRAQEYLSVDLHSHHYGKRRGVEGTLVLWLIEIPTSSETQSPYTYTIILIEKYRDVENNWVEN